jgi:hypothetical protein
LQQGLRALADVLPNAELRALEGVSYNVKMHLLAPVLADFFTRVGHRSPGQGGPVPP